MEWIRWTDRWTITQCNPLGECRLVAIASYHQYCFPDSLSSLSTLRLASHWAASKWNPKGSLLLTWIHFNPSVDNFGVKSLNHSQTLHRWSFGNRYVISAPHYIMDVITYSCRDYKIIHVVKSAPGGWSSNEQHRPPGRHIKLRPIAPMPLWYMAPVCQSDFNIILLQWSENHVGTIFVVITL